MTSRSLPTDSLSKRSNDRAVASVVTLVAFVIRVATLGDKGVSYDEAATALMSRASLTEIVAFHWTAAFEHLPLWVMLMHGWSRLSGQSEYALRFLPALAGVLTVPLLWALLRRVCSSDGPWRLVSVLLVALSPALILYAQESRMYSLVVLLGVASAYLLLVLLDASRWPIWVAFVAVNWSMLALQYYSALLLVAEAVFVTVAAVLIDRAQMRAQEKDASAPWRNASLALGAISVSGLPLLIWMAFAPGFHETVEVVLREAAKTDVSASSFAADLWRDLSFGAIRWQPDLAIAGFLFLPVFLVGVATAYGPYAETACETAHQLPKHKTWSSRWYLLFSLIVFVPFVVSLIMFRTLAARYILYVLPFIFAFIAFGILWLWRRTKLAGLVAFAVVLAVAVVGAAHYFGSYTKSEYREMASFLQNHYSLQEDSVLIEAPRQHLLAKYYLGQRFPLTPVPNVEVPDYWPLTAPLVVPEEVDDIVQDRLRTSKNLWLILSAEAEVDPGEFLAKYLTAVAYKQDCHQWLDVMLCQYVSPRTVDHQLTVAPHVRFGDELVLEDAHFGLPESPAPEQETPLKIQLDWWAKHSPSLDYKVSIKLLDSSGVVVSQADQLPIGQLLPPTTWAAGDRKPGYMVLAIPPGLEDGSYSLQVAVYDPYTLLPVQAFNAEGDTAADALELGLLEIDDTMRLKAASNPEDR